MKQLDLFTHPLGAHDKPVKETPDLWEVFIDGAARNNPGPAGAGIYILKNGEPIVREGFYLGSKTNNQAEYLSLLIGLIIVIDRMQPEDVLSIISDSQLLVRQIQGHYKVREPELQKLHLRAQQLLTPINYMIRHVLRDSNPIADALANQGIDKKTPLPPELAENVIL